MAKNKDSRYDAKTEVNYWPFHGDYKTTIRDKGNGNTHIGYGSTPEKSRNAAWRNTKNR